MYLNGQKFRGVLEKCSFTSLFFIKNAKINVFEEECFLMKTLYQIKMQAATNWSSHLNKHEIFEIFRTSDCLRNFQNHIFPRFLKIISSTRKNPGMPLILCEHGRQNHTKLV